MSVEGMWFFKSGSVEDPAALRDGGIVILESGRVFGGDSVMAYLGSYEAQNGKLTAKVRSFSWNHDVDGETVFGIPTPADYRVVFEGQTQSGHTSIDGSIWLEDHPDHKLGAMMVKVAELP